MEERGDAALVLLIALEPEAEHEGGEAARDELVGDVDGVGGDDGGARGHGGLARDGGNQGAQAAPSCESGFGFFAGWGMGHGECTT